MKKACIFLVSASIYFTYARAAMDSNDLGKAALLNVSPAEFDFSLLTKKSYNTRVIPNLALSGGVPALGTYATPYDLTKRLVLIESDPKLIPALLSQQSAETLVTQLGFSISDAQESVDPNASEPLKQQAVKDFLLQVLDSIGTKATFNIVIWNTLPSQDNSYNIAFHPVVSNWLYQDRALIPTAQWITSKNSPSITYPRYNVDLLAGIFDPQGVQPAATAPIAFNTVTPQNIHTHASDRSDYYDDMSPNNVRFTLNPNRLLATFWTVLFSPQKDRVALTFNILIKDIPLGELLEPSLKSIKNLDQLIDALNKLLPALKDKPEDSIALENVINLLAINQAQTS